MATASTDSKEPEDSPASRRDFIHIATVSATVGAVGASAWPLINSMNPAADTLAMASVEVDYSKVLLGQQIVVVSNGRPVFIRHRTPAEIAAAVADDTANLIDPATDASRHKPERAEWLIVIGICTHLGCVPNFVAGAQGGWHCPCHGSVYDIAGRVRRGPAPKNLNLPDYAFQSGSIVKIG